jgi:hypothetical protein
MSRVRWHTPGRAVAAIATAAIAVTGCAASAKVHSGPAAGVTSPAATAAATAPAPATTAAPATAPATVSATAPATVTATAPAPVPATAPAPAQDPQAASTGDPDGALMPAPAPPPPRCPPLARYAAGNAGPLFCTDGTDNPAALGYFTTLHLKIMRLSATASQAQAAAAICADLAHTASGTEYSAYLLAATREHWFFTGIAKVHGNLPSLCPKQ